jgi:hypothetical protein
MYSSDTEKCLNILIDTMTVLAVGSKQKSLRIKDLETEIEKLETEQDLDEIDKFNDSLVESDDNIKSTVNNQVKLPSQKSYITIDNFDMFV